MAADAIGASDDGCQAVQLGGEYGQAVVDVS